jgi:hypothetical protein
MKVAEIAGRLTAVTMLAERSSAECGIHDFGSVVARFIAGG